MAAVVRCPPDRQVLVDYLRLQEALTHEVLASCSGDEWVLADFQQLLLLLEHLSSLEYVNDSRLVKAALLAVRPTLTPAEAAVLTGSSIAVAAEEQLLAMIVQLLLRTRYFPLTQEEWALAQNYQFTFDIPVRINWSVLDDQLLTRFWERQAALHDALTSSSSNGSNGGDSSSGLAAATAAAAEAAQRLSSSGSPILQSVLMYPELLNRSALPSFVDRMLVFHRGVGVATSEGLFLNKKLDLLMAYLLVEPALRLLNRIKQQLAAFPAAPAAGDGGNSSRKRASRHGDVMVLNSYDGGAGSSLFSADEFNGSDSCSGSSDGVVWPFASADLQHQWATTVERRSLRSLMPGARQVLAHFWERLVLQEPTFRDVVVIYRAKSASAAGGTDTTNIQAAESAVTAALFAGSGAVAMAADAAVEAAQAVAEAGSAGLARGLGRGKKQPDGSAAATQDDKQEKQQQSQQPAAVSETAAAATAAAVAAPAAAAADAPEGAAAAAAAADAPEGAAAAAAAAGPSAAAPGAPGLAAAVLPPKGSSRRQALLLNPSNVCIRSFSDVAMADLELCFPSKQAEVTATTLVRSALTALGALGAAAACLQQASHLHWSLPVVLPAAGVVAGRSIKVLSTIRMQQAALNNTMMQMCYESACDSQDGVLVKLVDELRDQHLKEAATAYSIMLARQLQEQQAAESAGAGEGGPGKAKLFDVQEIDAACEEFLLAKFGLKIDFVVEEALPRMTAWGLVNQVGPRSYTLTPLAQALQHLKARWTDLLHTRHAAAAVAVTARQTATAGNSSSSSGDSHDVDAADVPAHPRRAPVAASAVPPALCNSGNTIRALPRPARIGRRQQLLHRRQGVAGLPGGRTALC